MEPRSVQSSVVGDASTLIGRERERAELSRALAAAAQGRGSVVVVEGEPGAGKSRLVAAATAEAGAFRVVASECFQGEEGFAFRCWSEAFRHLGLPGESFRGVIAPGQPLDGPDRSELDDASDLDRLRLFDAIVGLLGEQTMRQPWLLVMEDLHWADRSSLALLHHVARRVRRLPQLIIATCRDAEARSSPGLAAMETEIRERRLGQILSLNGLSMADSAELACALGLPLLDAAQQAALHESTGGNPFFVEEVVRHLTESGGRPLLQLPGSTAFDAVPPAVSEVLRQRIARRTAECVSVLSAAAVLGQAFARESVEQLQGIDAGASVAPLEEACAAGLLTRQSGAHYRFRHALVQRTLLAELSEPDSRRLHLAAAQLLARRGDHAATIARHYRAAHSVEHVDELLEQSKLAILGAADKLAWDESRELFGRTMETVDSLTVEPLVRARFLAQVLPMIFQRVGLSSDGLHQLAMSAVNPLLAAGEQREAASLLVVAFWPLVIQDSLVDSDPVKGLELMERVRELSGDPYAISCDAHAPFALFAAGKDDDVPVIAERLRRRSDFPAAGVGAILSDAVYAANRGRTAAARSGFEDAWQQTVAIGPGSAPAIVGMGGLAGRWSGEVWMRFRAPEFEGELAARELSLKRQHSGATRHLRFLVEVSRKERGLATAAHAELSRNDSFRPDWPHLRLLNLAFREGDWDRAFDTASAVLPRINAAAVEPRSMLVEQLAEWRRHWDPPGAGALIGSWQFEHHLPLIRMPSHLLAGLIAAEIGQFDAAQRHARLARNAIQAGDDWLGLGARLELLEATCALTRGDNANAQRTFAIAVREFQRVGHPWDESDAHYVFGSVLSSLGRADEARAHLDAALTILRRIEAPAPFLDRVQTARAAKTATQPVAGPLTELSQREAEVLLLLMEGRSNRDIASRLVISEATVATHVRHVLEKTRTANRTEVVALALRHGFAGTSRP